MRVRQLIRVFGVIDLLLIAWLVVTSLRAGRLPLLDDLRDDFAIAGSFSSGFWVFISIFPHVVLWSVVVSGVLMVFLRRAGAFLAIIQFPFRLFFIIQPTFFIIPMMSFGSSNFLKVGVIMFLEIVKVVVIVIFLKGARRMT